MSKIMIVDDEWAEREGMKYLIAKTGLGLEIEDAPNGAAALERLQQGAEIDILMTDIEMPFMDGLELCLRARELRPEMKTVIFSAHSQFEYAQKANRLSLQTTPHANRSSGHCHVHAHCQGA